MSDVLKANIEEQTDVRVVERVVDIPPLLAVPDKPARAKEPQVVADGGLREASDCREIADTELAGLEQGRDEAYAPRIRQDPEGLGEILKDSRFGQPLESRSHAFGIDALDFASVEGNHSRRLHH